MYALTTLPRRIAKTPPSMMFLASAGMQTRLGIGSFTTVANALTVWWGTAERGAHILRFGGIL